MTPPIRAAGILCLAGGNVYDTVGAIPSRQTRRKTGVAPMQGNGNFHLAFDTPT